MKKAKIYLGIIALCLLAITVIPNFYAAENTIYVRPGNGTLNTAISQAKAGDTIVLQSEGYYNGDKIVIDKDITIQGTNMSRDYVSQLFEIDGAANVTFKNLTLSGGAMITTQKNHYILDVKSQTNLTLDGVVLAYATRTDSDGKFTADVKNIYIRSGADHTELNIKDSYLNGAYDCVIVESSNNVITVEKSSLGGSLALALRNGEGNQVYIRNNSKIAGRSSFVENAEEAISIVGQKDLNIEVSDSELFGTAVSDRSGALVPAHLISFDDAESTNVNIKIMGDSRVEDDDKVGDSNIINFGSVTTPESNVSVLIEKSVDIIPSDMGEKYNTSDNYAVVGIRDYKGDWTIKPYAKNNTIPEENLPAEVVGYRLDKITYNTESATDEDYVKTMPITENTDIISHYIKLLNIHIDGCDETFYIDENKTFADLKAIPGVLDALNVLKNTDDGKKFKNYVVSYTLDSEEKSDTISDTQDEYTFVQDSTISADYINKVKVTLKVGDDERLTKYMDEGQCLDDLSEEDKKEFADAIESTTKRLKGYVEIVDEQEVVVDSKQAITKDITIIPKYEVDVKIGEDTFTIDEGATLETLSPENKQKLDAHKTQDKKDFKNFVKVVDDVEHEVIEETTPIMEHTDIVAKFTIKVTISGNEYVLDDGKNIQTLIDEQIDAKTALEELESVEGKTLDRFVDADGQPLTIYDMLNKHTTVVPIYTVKVTIGNEEFVLDENSTLEDLTGQDLERFNNLKTQRFSRFVNEDGETFEETEPITKDTVITALYNVKITISEEEFMLEEGKTLSDLSSEDKLRIEKLKEQHEPGEVYVGLKKSGTDDYIEEETTTFSEDTTLEIIFETLPGDVTRDGKINSEDAAKVIDLYTNQNATKEDLALGDVAEEYGQLNSIDAARILDMYVENNN